ncbi:MAG: hypothetical protein Q8O42_05965 [Acidobacteriota bacterium]|nr:hypothetical protein [Acidobacteriota bacterium]
MMPGTRLMQFARRWFPPSTVSSVFEPLVADWQRESTDATPARRRLINVRGRLAFAFTVVMMMPRLSLSPLKHSRALERSRPRPLALAGAFWLITSCLLLIALVRDEVPLRFLWLLLPGFLTMMLPAAILPAIDAMRRDGGEPTTADRRWALALVAIAVCGVAIGQGWLTPVSNQRFRNETMTEMSGRPTLASRGVREVTTSELIAGDVAITPALAGVPRVRELNMRLSLALLPAVLAWLRWQSLTRWRRRSWPVARSFLLAIGATAAFIMTMPAGPALERLFQAPGFGPTLALGLFALVARSGIWWRQRAV